MTLEPLLGSPAPSGRCLLKLSVWGWARPGMFLKWARPDDLQGYLTYKKRPPLGPYRRRLLRVLGGS